MEEVRGEIRFRSKKSPEGARREAAERKSPHLRAVFTEPQQARALVMLVIEGCTVKEVARRFGVSAWEVRKLKASGR